MPAEVLKSILDSGQIDAAISYKHEAIAIDLPYITLPDQINLSEPNYTNFYNKISYKLETGETIYGNPIIFSFTIPNTAKNIEGAFSFAKFLLSEKGKKILEKFGLSPFKPILQGDRHQLKPEVLSLF